jgi:hypothetical protein
VEIFCDPLHIEKEMSFSKIFQFQLLSQGIPCLKKKLFTAVIEKKASLNQADCIRRSPPK